MLQKLYGRVFNAGHVVISLLLVLSAFSLIVLAVHGLWTAINPLIEREITTRFNEVLDTVSLLVIAAASLSLGQTVFEEEVLRGSLLRAPTRVRHFISRFMLVIVVALSIEALVAVFHFTREAPQYLPHAGIIGFAAGGLLVAWGIFIKQNTSAERLEPESIEATKRQEEEIESNME